MGRHAAPMADAPEGWAAVAAPIAPTVHPAYPASPALVPAPAPAPVSAYDEFTAVNLLVPRQQSLPIRALVWGILSLVLYIAVLPSILAIVFGALGVARARRLEAAGLGPQGRGMSTAGLVLGILGAVLGVLMIVALVVIGTLGSQLQSQQPVTSYGVYSS